MNKARTGPPPGKTCISQRAAEHIAAEGRQRRKGACGIVAPAVKPLPPKAVAGRPGFTRASTPATIATGGPMGCGSRPCARAKPPLPARYITHSKFNRAIEPPESHKLL
jgi:hypothetical protein